MSQDFTDMLQALSAAKVRFLIVGAHALAVHGVPRATGDLDIWVHPDPDNANRVMTALSSFGAPVEALGISVHDFTRTDIVAQLGVPPYRIDFMTSISGVEFDEAWADHQSGDVAGVAVPVLGRRAFVINKRSSGRLKDRADLEALGEG